MPIISNVRELNERITIMEVSRKSPSPHPNSTEKIELFSCWAQVRTQNIKDIREGVISRHEDLVEFVVRHKQPIDIKASMMVRWNGDEYYIKKVNRDNAYKSYDVLLCSLK